MSPGTVNKLSATENNERSAERAPAFPKAKFLLVDHDNRDLEHYCQILRNEGYEVTPCTRYVEAARLLEREVFDFIVTSQGTRALEGLCVLSLALEIDR